MHSQRSPDQEHAHCCDASTECCASSTPRSGRPNALHVSRSGKTLPRVLSCAGWTKPLPCGKAWGLERTTGVGQRRTAQRQWPGCVPPGEAVKSRRKRSGSPAPLDVFPGFLSVNCSASCCREMPVDRTVQLRVQKGMIWLRKTRSFTNRQAKTVPAVGIGCQSPISGLAAAWIFGGSMV